MVRPDCYCITAPGPSGPEFGSRWAIAQRTVRSLGVVVPPPFFDDDLCFSQTVENLAVQQLVAHPAVEAFAVPILPRLPGSMNAVFAPTALIHLRTASATNSGPLSDLMNRGTPRRMNRSDSASITSIEFSFLFTRIARHSRVNSSSMFNVLNALPSSVRQWTKSYDQTWFRYSGRSRMQEPSANHSVPSLVASLVLSAPLVARAVRRGRHSQTTRHPAATLRSSDSHTDRIGRVSSIMSATNLSSSARPCGTRRCVERC